MKINRVSFIPVILTFLFASCSMPELSNTTYNPNDLLPDDISTQENLPPENVTALSITTDTSRNQGIFINEEGLQIDIKSIDESSGDLIRCIEAVDIAIIDNIQPSLNIDPASPTVKAIVVGKRDDGLPGIWEIHSDDSIHSPWNEIAEARNSLLPESFERQESLRYRFDWIYEVTDISDDGRLAVGYAVNKEGFNHGRWTIEPGTTVGVYWRLKKSQSDTSFGIRRAEVIGIRKAPNNYRFSNQKRHHQNRLLNRLRLFFLDWFETYLIMADSIKYNDEKDVFLVQGTDQEGINATATIDLWRGVLSIEEDQIPEEKPDLTVTMITVPETAMKTSDTWELGARISNIDSTTDAAGSTLKYYLSSDEILDTAIDTLIGSKAVGPIAAGSYVDDLWSTSFSITEVGRWYIFAVADADSEVTESDEGNNTLSDSVDIISGSNRIVIQTFSPTGAYIAYTDTYLALFDSNGDPSPETPYIDTDALAVDDNSNPDHLLYSYLDYPEGLAPGTYYIKVRGASSNQTGPYGIRVVSDPAAPYSYFASTNPAAAPWNDSYENDDAMTGGVPDNPLSIKPDIQEDWHNRALSESDIDWYILTIE